MGYTDKVINVQNVGAGKVAIIDVPLGITYDKFRLSLGGGLLPAHLTLIEGFANGRRIFNDQGALIQKRRAYLGATVDAGFVTLDYTEPNARGGAMPQYLASIPSNLLNKLSFQVTIDAAAPVGSTLEVQYEGRPPTNNANIMKRLDFSQAFAAAGEHSLFLPTGSDQGGIIKRIWMHSTNITNVDMRLDRQSAVRATQAQLQQGQIENKLVPQAGITVLDFVQDGNLMGALNTMNSKGVELRLTMDAADTVNCWIDYIDPINRL